VKTEKVIIKSIKNDTVIELSSPLRKNHYVDETVYTSVGYLGFSTDPIAVTDTTKEFEPTIGHEMLHLDEVGDLIDVDEEDNEMYYSGGGNGQYLLRYRELKGHYDNTDIRKQWDKVHGK
jgi:hypothetical protein